MLRIERMYRSSAFIAHCVVLPSSRHARRQQDRFVRHHRRWLHHSDSPELQCSHPLSRCHSLFLPLVAPQRPENLHRHPHLPLAHRFLPSAILLLRREVPPAPGREPRHCPLVHSPLRHALLPLQKHLLRCRLPHRSASGEPCLPHQESVCHCPTPPHHRLTVVVPLASLLQQRCDILPVV